jgi:hypothetical protein
MKCQPKGQRVTIPATAPTDSTKDAALPAAHWTRVVRPISGSLFRLLLHVFSAQDSQELDASRLDGDSRQFDTSASRGHAASLRLSVGRGDVFAKFVVEQRVVLRHFNGSKHKSGGEAI